jgi:GNAT superfamily N-acetyltransferase
MTYVDRRFRRKGFGFRITKELVSWLKKQKVKHIEAGFYYNNLPSIEMCRKLGFKPISLKMRLY